MILTEGSLPGTYIVEPERVSDSRGFFARAFCERKFEEHGLAHMVQGNTSFNHRRGTIRGLHYQAAPHQEAKFVRCTRGAIFDVAVDVRPDSSTYGHWMGVTLTPENGRAFYVPEGCAHGYLSLEDDSESLYFTS
ncbi:MAG: dTDP-4-dehydrorhamnose 3,5-epimerase family protein, partial [Salinivenus sp.]